MRVGIGIGRREKKKRVGTTLNLTALIDLFTVLVLFLLFQLVGGGEVLPASEKLRLPDSISTTPPQATVTVLISVDNITVEGKRIVGIQEVLEVPDLLIVSLKEELDFHAQKAKDVGEAMGVQVFKGKVTILGDHMIPFKLLEKVMYTCSLAEFSDINLAVIQKESLIL